MIDQYKTDIENVVLPDLSKLEGKSILVTGATGLIGKCLVKMLHYRNVDSAYFVYAGCRNVARAKKQIGIDESTVFKYVNIDVTKHISVECNFDYIIDAASSASPNQFKSDPVGVMKANLYGVCNLLDYGIAHGLKRFLYISSGEVYGQGDGKIWVENDNGFVDQMSLRSAYPSSKRCSETLCVAYAEQYGVDIVVARLCHTYGPEFQDNDNRAYAQFFRNARDNSPIVLKSKGGQIRSWLYVVDCVSGILHILLNGKDLNAYNVADRLSNLTVAEFAELVANVIGTEIKYDIENDVNATPITSALFDTCKIEDIGWKPCFNIEEGIRHSINPIS